MKKIIVPILVVLLFASCSEDSANRIAGKWKLTAWSENGAPVSLSACELGSTVTFLSNKEFKAVDKNVSNGTCVEELSEGTWSNPSQNLYLITVDGYVTQANAAFSGKNMSITIPGDDGAGNATVTVLSYIKQ
jgi:hypothetical protein